MSAGSRSIGAITTYMSDNPAILALAADKNYRCYFKKYQVPALTNLGRILWYRERTRRTCPSSSADRASPS